MCSSLARSAAPAAVGGGGGGSGGSRNASNRSSSLPPISSRTADASVCPKRIAYSYRSARAAAASAKPISSMKTSSSVPHQIPFPAAWSCRARCAASGVETAARDAAGAASARRSRPLTSAAKALPPHRASTSDASVRRSRCASYARATAASCASDASPTTRASSGATSSRRASPISAAVSAAANGSTAAAGGAALLLCASSRSSATASGSSFRAFSRSASTRASGRPQLRSKWACSRASSASDAGPSASATCRSAASVARRLFSWATAPDDDVPRGLPKPRSAPAPVSSASSV